MANSVQAARSEVHRQLRFWHLDYQYRDICSLVLPVGVLGIQGNLSIANCSLCWLPMQGILVQKSWPSASAIQLFSSKARNWLKARRCRFEKD